MIDYQKLGFLPYQIAWLKDPAPIKLYEKSRRIGITYVQAFEDVLDTSVYNVCDVWFSSNNEGNAREYIIYCKRFAKAMNAIIINEGGDTLVDDDNQRMLSITFKNGRRITALTSNPDQLHGKGGKIILDEFARRENEFETWEAASPAAMVWQHPIRIISTHRGKGSLFYSFVQRIEKKQLTWSRHRTTFIDAVRQGLADKVVGKTLTQKQRDNYVEVIRNESASPLIWRQQYMCEPVDDNETFLPYTLLDPASKATLKPLRLLSACNSLYAGLDVGRIRNLSVLWIAEKIDNIFVTRHVRPIKGKDFPEQEKIIGQYMALPNMRRLCVDRTGMGIGLTDHLQKYFGASRVEGIHFTSQNKEIMAFRMRKYLEDLSFLIPDSETIKDDLNSVQRTATAAGNIRLSANENPADGSHADYFWAAALMLEAADAGGWVKPEVQNPTDYQKYYSRFFTTHSGWSRLK